MGYGDTDLWEYFDRKGSVEVLLAVHPKDGTLTEDVKSAANCAKATAKDRIYEATDLGLLEHETHKTVEHKSGKRQFLTAKGRACVVVIASIRLDETLKAIKYYEKERERQKNELKEWLKSGGDAKLNGLDNDRYIDSFKKEHTYPGEGPPDNFDEFIFSPMDDSRWETINFEQLLDYENLYDTEDD